MQRHSRQKSLIIGKDSVLLEFVQTATKNDAVIKLMKEEFTSIEVVRGGSVGIESIKYDGKIKKQSALLNFNITVVL